MMINSAIHNPSHDHLLQTHVLRLALDGFAAFLPPEKCVKSLPGGNLSCGNGKSIICRHVFYTDWGCSIAILDFRLPKRTCSLVVCEIIFQISPAWRYPFPREGKRYEGFSSKPPSHYVVYSSPRATRARIQPCEHTQLGVALEGPGSGTFLFSHESEWQQNMRYI